MNPIGSLLEEQLVLDWEQVLEVLLSRMLSAHDLLGKEHEAEAQHEHSSFPRKLCV